MTHPAFERLGLVFTSVWAVPQSMSALAGIAPWLLQWRGTPEQAMFLCQRSCTYYIDQGS